MHEKIPSDFWECMEEESFMDAQMQVLEIIRGTDPAHLPAMGQKELLLLSNATYTNIVTQLEFSRNGERYARILFFIHGYLRNKIQQVIFSNDLCNYETPVEDVCIDLEYAQSERVFLELIDEHKKAILRCAFALRREYLVREYERLLKEKHYSTKIIRRMDVLEASYQRVMSTFYSV
jgi:hypothetical protein